jgi:hypothetical protein
MREDTISWFKGLALLSRGHLVTQTAVLLPVVVIAGLTAWSMLSMPTSATGQPPGQTVGRSGPHGVPNRQDVAVLTTAPESQTPQAGQAVPAEPAALGGLKISSQSWRRGGLGSNALVTFTLRNDNDYAVKDIEIACSFSRKDGSHLTDRKRLIPDAVVDMKSRKTFARIHIGFVNIYANKAKCLPVAANRI